MNNMPLSRQSEIVIQELKNETLIYDLKINKAYCLNETIALIWQMCDGTRNVAEISRLMSLELRSKVTEDIVRLALDDLKKEGLLVNGESLEKHFPGQTRRQVIKAIGLMSTVALPIISGLVAPQAIQAASDACAGVICNDNNACTIDTCDPLSGCIFTPIVCPVGQSCNIALGCVPIPR